MGSLAEDLLVLAVMAENAGVRSARRMPCVLRGAELIQLCIDGRITVTDGRIKVVNAGETGSPDLDAALAFMAQRGQQPEKRRRLGEIARECQSAGPVLEAIAGEQQHAMRAAMGPVMRSALSWGNDPAALVALNSLNHTTGPDVSHHSPGGHGHGGGHHG